MGVTLSIVSHKITPGYYKTTLRTFDFLSKLSNLQPIRIINFDATNFKQLSPKPKADSVFAIKIRIHD